MDFLQIKTDCSLNNSVVDMGRLAQPTQAFKILDKTNEIQKHREMLYNKTQIYILKEEKHLSQSSSGE